MKTHKGKYVVIGIYFLITVVLTLLTPFIAPVIGKVVTKHVTELPASLVPDNADKFARDYISNLKDKNLDKAVEMTVPEANVTVEQFTEISDQLANIQTETGKVISSSVEKNSNGSEYELKHQFNNNVVGKEYLVADTVIYDTDAGLKVAGIHLYTGPTSAINTAFSFDFKKQGLSWALLILISLFVTWSALNYLKYSPKPRWWLLLVILLVALKIEVLPNDNVSIHIGPFVSSNVGNAIFLVLIPLGALYYWIARKKIFTKEQVLLNNQNVSKEIA